MAQAHGQWRLLPATSERLDGCWASLSCGTVQIFDHDVHRVRAVAPHKGSQRLFVVVLGPERPISWAAVLLQDGLRAWNGCQRFAGRPVRVNVC